LASAGVCGGSATINATTIPANGTYSVKFDAAGTDVGTGTVNLTLQ
jgi:hypothetical protein